MFRCFNKKSKQLRLCSAGFNQVKVEGLLLFVLGKTQTLSRERGRRKRKKPS